MIKFLIKLSYKLGELSTKAPKVSIKPVKEIYKSFKQGRADSKPTDITI